MKLLSIGNSFSTDAHRFLHTLAVQNSLELDTANLFIGGCSLQTHWQNVCEDNAYYDYELNGNETEAKISIKSALDSQKWDVITLQQASADSGIYSTYQPYLSSLAAFVREHQPRAKLYFHQTWSYENGSEHPGFLNYERDSRRMFESIVSASEKAAESIGADLIRTGTVIQYLRENTKVFGYENGGISLCRDTFHLSETYGRYAAAATWLSTLTGEKLTAKELDGMDIKLLEIIMQAISGGIKNA
ncbi:MAG: DUF4886 domain-containing protein [Clostridia bacterium]|nr:DUF4886 domain-containing protein [Clostridia bacterium]